MAGDYCGGGGFKHPWLQSTNGGLEHKPVHSKFQPIHSVYRWTGRAFVGNNARTDVRYFHLRRRFSRNFWLMAIVSFAFARNWRDLIVSDSER
jgi:hypothetical protein